MCSTMMWFCFFFKQKTAYEMRISDWSSDVCSSDLMDGVLQIELGGQFDHVCRIGVHLVAGISLGRAAMAAAVVARSLDVGRSEARRVGKECVSTCRSRRSP